MKIFKGILTVALLVLFNSLLFAQNETKNLKNTLIEDNLKGKVSIVTELTFAVIEKFGETQKGDLLSKFIKKYNEKGNVIELNNYESDGSLQSKDISKYNDNGNEIEKYISMSFS